MSTQILEPKKDTLPVSQPSEEEFKAYGVIAKKSLKENLCLTQKAIEKNQKFASVVKTKISPEKMVADSTSISSVQFGIASEFIHNDVYTNTPLHFPDMDVRFSGDGWGAGIGGGVVWLSGWFTGNGASTLGDASYSIVITSLITEIQFFRGGVLIGDLTGTGLNVQFGGFQGSGSFKRW